MKLIHRRLNRRQLLGLSLSTAVLTACGRTDTSSSTVASPVATAASPAATTAAGTAAAAGGTSAAKLRLGFQPPYVAVYTLQEQKLLEKAFAGKPTSFEAFRMLSLKPVTEAIASSAIDLGIGGTPIPGIAADLPIRVIAIVERSPKTHAILVSPNSPIKTPADLKGKKVGTPTGKSHLLVLKVLEKAGLKDTDIEWVQLENDAGRAALQQGAIDAWATWDPFYASVETAGDAVAIADGDGYINNFVVVFGRNEYLDQYPDTVKQFLSAYKESVAWVNANRAAAAEILVQQNKLSPEAAKLTLDRRNIVLEAPNQTFREDMDYQTNLLLQLQLIKKQPTWDQVIDPSFAQAVLT
jgi:sulfonate transport system substrate-binding protein